MTTQKQRTGFPVSQPPKPHRYLNPRVAKQLLTAWELYEECRRNPRGATGVAAAIGCTAKTIFRHLRYDGEGRGPRMNYDAARRLHDLITSRARVDVTRELQNAAYNSD